MTRYRIAVEVDVDGDLTAQELAGSMPGIARRFPDAVLEVASLHPCPQCRQWHEQGRGNPTFVSDSDMWCPVCRSIVSATPGEPQRGLYTSAVLLEP